MDACAHAGRAAGAGATLLTTQRAALRALGVRAQRPPPAPAGSYPSRYLRALRQAAEEGELLDPGALGGHFWLVQSAGVPLPETLAALSADCGSMAAGSGSATARLWQHERHAGAAGTAGGGTGTAGGA
jgi:hypothetical protein